MTSVTTDQLSLIDGDAASQWRFVLSSILDDALRVVRTASVDGSPADQHTIDRALDLVRQIASELQALGREDDIPF